MKRPIIVGLEPANRQKTIGALDGGTREGRKLAALCGFDLPKYEAAFERAYLHPDPGRHPSEDADAVAELEDRLEGRRVIAIGSRVAFALGIQAKDAPASWFEWNLARAAYVGAIVPSTHGRSRWWGSSKNLGAARRFFRAVLSPCVHVEGPDGSGKSTAALVLADRLGANLVRSEGFPTPTPAACHERIAARLAPGTVADRSGGLLSELIYAPVQAGSAIARPLVLPENVLWTLARAVYGPAIVVYCTPPKLRPRFHDHEPPAYRDLILSREAEIRGRYDGMIARLEREGSTVIRYDCTQQTVGGLIEQIRAA
jgi:hypothetical protein